MLKKLTILILDAEKDSREEMQDFLQREGFKVLPANSAAEGKLVLQQTPVDIMILDICLPDANGMELLKEYRVKYPNLEVIVISGFGDINSVIQALRLGVLDFLKKPVGVMDLEMAFERSHNHNIRIQDFHLQ